MSIYSNAERHGLRLVGSIDWGSEAGAEAYDISAVWIDPDTSTIYLAEEWGDRTQGDRPFQYATRDALTEVPDLEVLRRYFNAFAYDRPNWGWVENILASVERLIVDEREPVALEVTG